MNIAPHVDEIYEGPDGKLYRVLSSLNCQCPQCQGEDGPGVVEYAPVGGPKPRPPERESVPIEYE